MCHRNIQHFYSATARACVLMGFSFFTFIPVEGFDYDFQSAGLLVGRKQYLILICASFIKEYLDVVVGDLEKVE